MFVTCMWICIVIRVHMCEANVLRNQKKLSWMDSRTNMQSKRRETRRFCNRKTWIDGDLRWNDGTLSKAKWIRDRNIEFLIRASRFPYDFSHKEHPRGNTLITHDVMQSRLNPGFYLRLLIEAGLRCDVRYVRRNHADIQFRSWKTMQWLWRSIGSA